MFTQRTYFLILINLLIYSVLQVLVFRNIVIWEHAHCFIYLSIFFILPAEMERSLQLIIAFLIGISLDVFENSLGVHAFSSVLLVFLRPIWIMLVFPRGGFEGKSIMTMHRYGIRNYVKYMLPLIAVHHLAFFAVKAQSFDLILYILIKTLLSGLFTFLVILLIQTLFYTSTRNVYE